MESGKGEHGDALADVIRRLRANGALLREAGIAGVSVFGSVARGDAGEDSDVDLLVEPAPGVRVSGLKLVQWNTMMSELLGRSADVVVREFLADKIEETMELHLIEVIFSGTEDVGDAG